SPNGYVYTITLENGVVYAGGDFDSLGGAARSSLGAVDAASGLATRWSPAVNGTVSSIVSVDSTIYVGGIFNSLGGEQRSYVGALDARTALPTSWNPEPDGFPDDMKADAGTLYMGGVFNSVGGLPQSGLAAISIPGLSVPALVSLLNSEVSSRSVLLRWYAASGTIALGQVERREGAGNWSVLGDAVLDASGEWVYADTTVIPGHRYDYRLEAMANGQESFSEETWIQVPVEAFALYGSLPNPAFRHYLTVAFSLQNSTPARIRVFDVSGRQRLSQDLGHLEAGYHVSRLNHVADWSPGVYWIELSQGSRRARSRVVVLD